MSSAVGYVLGDLGSNPGVVENFRLSIWMSGVSVYFVEIGLVIDFIFGSFIVVREIK